jgi:hypothetical protein
MTVAFGVGQNAPHPSRILGPVEEGVDASDQVIDVLMDVRAGEVPLDLAVGTVDAAIERDEHREDEVPMGRAPFGCLCWDF